MLTPQAVAVLLGISPRAVYSLPIPRYQITRRAVRYLLSDVEAYRESCRSAGIRGTSVGATSLTVTLKAADTGLQSYFRKAGVEPRLTPTMSKKPATSLKLVTD